MSISIMISPGNTGMDEPPGIQAFSLRPPRIPPAISSSFLNGVPIGTSKLPGLFTWPETENSLVPPLLGLPSSCLLYTSDAADDLLCVDLGGRRIIKKKQI